LGRQLLQPSACRGWLVWDKENGDNVYADCELAWTNLPTSDNGVLKSDGSAAAGHGEQGRTRAPDTKAGACDGVGIR
jgi:hypothetical protein